MEPCPLGAAQSGCSVDPTHNLLNAERQRLSVGPVPWTARATRQMSVFIVTVSHRGKQARTTHVSDYSAGQQAGAQTRPPEGGVPRRGRHGNARVIPRGAALWPMRASGTESNSGGEGLKHLPPPFFEIPSPLSAPPPRLHLLFHPCIFLLMQLSAFPTLAPDAEGREERHAGEHKGALEFRARRVNTAAARNDRAEQSAAPRTPARVQTHGAHCLAGPM